MPFLRDGPYAVVTCAGCGLKLVTPRADVAAVKRFFKQEYIREGSTIEQKFTSPRQASLRREAAILRSMLARGGTLLDIGTASGAFLGEFEGDANWHVQAVEPSPVAAQAAAQKYGVTVHTGFLDDQAFADGTFDVVTSLDAFLLHAEPNKDAAEIWRILKPGGLFAVDIPGLKFRLMKGTGLGARLLYGGGVHLHVGVNLFYYTRDTLTRLLGNSGFQLVASYPEQAPVYGSLIARSVNHCYFAASSALYGLTSGRMNYAPKEFIVYRKAG
jgi:SAM-dependent methyltransferase